MNKKAVERLTTTTMPLFCVISTCLQPMRLLICTKIFIKRGTDIVAVALDDSNDDCYEALKEIYPSVVSCTDLKRLTGQLLGIISKNFR